MGGCAELMLRRVCFDDKLYIGMPVGTLSQPHKISFKACMVIAYLLVSLSVLDICESNVSRISQRTANLPQFGDSVGEGGLPRRIGGRKPNMCARTHRTG